MVCGVYKIGFSNTNKVYIGSSKDIEKRFKQHRAMLEADCHHSYKLQEYYNQNKALVSYTIVEECEEYLRTTIEANFINKHNSISNGFNVAQVQHAYNPELEAMNSLIHMPAVLPLYSKFLSSEYSTTIAVVASYIKFNYDLCFKNGLKYGETYEAISKNTNISVSTIRSAIRELKDTGIILVNKEGSVHNMNYYEFSSNSLVLNKREFSVLYQNKS